jgi:hypothetical protein
MRSAAVVVLNSFRQSVHGYNAISRDKIVGHSETYREVNMKVAGRFLFLLLFIALLNQRAYCSSTKISFEPGSQRIPVDSTAVFIVKIDSVHDLKGYEIILFLDEEVVELDDLVFENFFGALSFRFITRDRLGSRVTVTEVLAGGGGRTKDGNLFRVHLKGKKPSVSEIKIESADLRDSMNNSIPASVGSASITIDGTSSAYNDKKIENYYAVYQNYPNPFNARTIIPIRMDNAGIVTISIFTILGEELTEYRRTISFQAGTHFYDLMMESLPSGVYVYRVDINPLVSGTPLIQTRAMILSK